jgi:uncharacterized protein (UPF0333 family)
MALSSEVAVSLAFGLFMAIVALIAIWQIAHYAAHGRRGMSALIHHSISVGRG